MSVLITLCILLFSILIHETGHFLAARRFNYAVNEFSIGMGPKLIQKTKNEIAYTIRLLPLGGYVSFAEESKNQRCISAPSLSKCVVLIMGAAFNLLLSILCFSLFFTISGYDCFQSIYESICFTCKYISILFGSPDTLFSIDSYGSIVSLVSYTNETLSMAVNLKQAVAYVLSIGGVLNISLAIVNLLPLPILDGGQILINTVELIAKRTIPQRAKLIINAVSWLLIMTLMVFLITRDIKNLV